jgi:hypothetical protein
MSVLVLWMIQVVPGSAATQSIRGSHFSSLLKAQRGGPRSSSNNLRGLQAATVAPIMDDDDFFDQMNMNDNKDGKTVPNDAYHCRDPALIEEYFWKDKTVQCDWDTYEWKTDKLDAAEIPEHCIQEGFVFTTVAALKDWQEPCYLWMTLYGDLHVSMATLALANATSTSTSGNVTTKITGRRKLVENYGVFFATYIMLFISCCLSHTYYYIIGYWMLDIGYWILDTVYCISSWQPRLVPLLLRL